MYITNNSQSFGIKMSTRSLVELSSGIGIEGTFNRNVETINKLADNKIDIINTSALGCRFAFASVTKMIRKQLPQLQPFIDAMSKFPWDLSEDQDEEICSKFNNLLNEAEQTVGKELDISTEDIEKYLIRIVG